MLAVSPDDGKVVRRLRILLRDIQGIAWVDGDLAVAQKEKKFALVDPETGEVTEQQDIFRAGWLGWVGGLEKVRDEIWVTDVFNCVIVSYPPKGTSLGEEKFRGLGGPAPVGMAAVNGSVWHYDWLTPRIIYRGNTEGKLLDWCSIPIDSALISRCLCSSSAIDSLICLCLALAFLSSSSILSSLLIFHFPCCYRCLTRIYCSSAKLDGTVQYYWLTIMDHTYCKVMGDYPGLIAVDVPDDPYQIVQQLLNFSRYL